ncbi:PolC-type DNA polymerase III [Thaumasiovibrio sp. DFM-14]|uniref:3'-5' exonuclease n=1 Tax=Thaumasiovibrio sp. DFM-14 TaxID=3384792 RepID=UPI00399FDF9B
MLLTKPASSVVVLDFETTGLSPNQGDRAIEIGAVKLENGRIVDRFQRLMNPGKKVSRFIENYTGISNEMLVDAADCGSVMHDFADFIANSNLVAHNASFDQRFLDAEFARIERGYEGTFACSMLIARRLLQQAPSHKLGELVHFCNIDNDGTFHRALADAEMTTSLWLRLLEEVQQYGIQNADFALMRKISKTPKAAVHSLLCP